MIVSIVIAVHNEVESLAQLLAELDAFLMTVADEFELLIVNDASTDGTGEALTALAGKYPFLQVVHLAQRGGQTGCYQVAFAKARGDYIIRMDGDLQDDPKDLGKFFGLLHEAPDLIMGLRENRRHRRLMRVATTLYDALIMILLDSPLHSNSSSFVAFKADYVRGVALRPYDHRYLPLIAIRRGATRLREVIVGHRGRQHGRSKYNEARKVSGGVVQVLAFLTRLALGRYDRREPGTGETTEAT